MSKYIKIPQSSLDAVKKEFDVFLSSSKHPDGRICFNKVLGNIERKATVYFTELAWLKMQGLIKEFSNEVAWHGVAHRGEDMSKDEYHITDILVYPQEVSGASVEMDVAKYDEWLRNNYEDDRFNNIRMQGHSHVNMGVSPSGVDLSHQEAILDQLTDDMFYIFMIWNKSGNKHVKIYDMLKNVLFEDSDVTVEAPDFIKEAKSVVQEKSYKYTPDTSYYTSLYTSSNNNQKTIGFTAETDKKDEKNKASNDEKPKKKKGRRKKNHTQVVNACEDTKPSLPFNDHGYDYDSYWWND